MLSSHFNDEFAGGVTSNSKLHFGQRFFSRGSSCVLYVNVLGVDKKKLEKKIKPTKFIKNVLFSKEVY